MEKDLGLCVTFQHTKDPVKYDPQVTIIGALDGTIYCTAEDIRKLPKMEDDVPGKDCSLVKELLRMVNQKRVMIAKKEKVRSPLVEVTNRIEPKILPAKVVVIQSTKTSLAINDMDF